MNTLQASVFTDETAEFNNIQSASPSIDLTDSPLPNYLLNKFTSNTSFLITAAQGSVGYYEVEFDLANNFWGCGFNFGNSACGVQIRQGLSHMIDKNSFVSNEAAIAGHAAAIDNPLPNTSGGGLLSPNPCGYDASFTETGTNCVVGTNFLGAISYHLAAAAGANGFPWLPALGSPDLNAASQHFVNAGLASGFNSTTSILRGITAAASSNPPSFFIRNDDTSRLDLGNSLSAEICYLFTGSYATPCTYLTVVRGNPNSCFGGNCCIDTCNTGVNLSWWMYTASFNGPTFYDGSLYQTYNSHFVSGVPSIQQPTGPCDPGSVPSDNPSNYVYSCDPAYDSLSNQMEFSPCLSGQGDPIAGATSNLPTSPGNGLCSGTTQLSSHSAGIQAEAEFGSRALTLPVFETTVQYGYLNNGWTRVDNGNSIFGLANFFTWLDGRNPAPVVPQTIRQGFAGEVTSVNPFVAHTPRDLNTMGNVYDSLYASDPAAPSQIMNWMTISTFQLSNSSLNYPAPAHTLTTYRFTMRSDLYFHDGRPVTSYDVAFSYLSMVGAGTFLGAGAAPMTGITILGPRQFDIGVNSLGLFTLPNLTSIPILPGRYWTNAGGSAWDNAISSCTGSMGCGKSQYSLSGANSVCNSNAPFSCAPFSASLMTVNPADATATFDPVSNHIFVGSGAWTCGTVTTSSSGTCTSSGTMIVPPGGSWTLTRFGAGVSTITESNEYFRSSSNAALWIWSEQGEANSFLNFAALVSCYGQPVNLSGPCAHWQQGLGNPGAGSMVGISQVAVVNRFFTLNWVNGGPPSLPYDWATNPPVGISPFAPVLYEGSTTLSPQSAVGCPNGYDC